MNEEEKARKLKQNLAAFFASNVNFQSFQLFISHYVHFERAYFDQCLECAAPGQNIQQWKDET